MTDFWRSIASRLLGWRYVTLIDFDGERNVRRVEFCGGMPFARRHRYDIANAYLLDGGATSGVSYTKSWEPYEPSAAKRWPVPA